MLKLLMADTGAARADPLASALPSVLAHALLPVRAPSRRGSQPGKTSGKPPPSGPGRTSPFLLFLENVTAVASSRKASRTRPDALSKLSASRPFSHRAFSQSSFAYP